MIFVYIPSSGNLKNHIRFSFIQELNNQIKQKLNVVSCEMAMELKKKKRKWMFFEAEINGDHKKIK